MKRKKNTRKSKRFSCRRVEFTTGILTQQHVGKVFWCWKCSLFSLILYSTMFMVQKEAFEITTSYIFCSNVALVGFKIIISLLNSNAWIDSFWTEKISFFFHKAPAPQMPALVLIATKTNIVLKWCVSSSLVKKIVRCSSVLCLFTVESYF